MIAGLRKLGTSVVRTRPSTLTRGFGRVFERRMEEIKDAMGTYKALANDKASMVRSKRR